MNVSCGTVLRAYDFVNRDEAAVEQGALERVARVGLVAALAYGRLGYTIDSIDHKMFWSITVH